MRLLFPLLCLTASSFIVALAQGAIAHAETSLPTGEVSAAPAGVELAPASRAITFNADYKIDTLTPNSAEIESQTHVIGSFILGVDADLQRSIGWNGARLAFQAMANHGGDQDLGIGDAQGANNIQSLASAKLYQFWIEQNFLDDRVSLLAGIHDMNYEFNLTDSSAILMNSSFALTPELGMSGVTGPSTFTATTLGLRALVKPLEQLSLRAAVYNGVGGNPDQPTSPLPRITGNDGVLGIAELAYGVEINQLAGKLALGTWGYSNADMGKKGVYLLGEQQLYAPTAGEAAGLYAFARAGVAEALEASINRSIQTGLSYHSPFGRAKDDVSVGVALAGAHSLAPVERAWEVTYRAHLLRDIYLQPDLQLIDNPGFVDTSPAVVGALRAHMVL